MRLPERVALLAAVLTVTGMFFVIKYLLPLLSTYLGEIPGLEFLIAFAASVGLYRLLLSSLHGLLQASLPVRRKLLGAEFLEGTWVGCMRREPREYTVERFRQESGVLEVEGSSYLDGADAPRAHWKSTSSVINGRTVLYSYTCRIEGRDSDDQGIAVFDLKWEASSAKAANRLEGYAADLTDGKRDSNTEFKVSDDWRMDTKAALRKAQALFGSPTGARPATEATGPARAS